MKNVLKSVYSYVLAFGKLFGGGRNYCPWHEYNKGIFTYMYGGHVYGYVGKHTRPHGMLVFFSVFGTAFVKIYIDSRFQWIVTMQVEHLNFQAEQLSLAHKKSDTGRLSSK